MQDNLLNNMNKTIIKGLLLPLATLLVAGCWGSRYVSADADLEAIYMGKSYYEIVEEFGNPDITTNDEEGGSRITYNYVTLRRTSAAPLYKQYNMRNRNSHEEGAPGSRMTFSFNVRMKCYAVESDFQREKKKTNVQKEETWKQTWGKPRVPRTMEFPHVTSRSPYAEVVSIERIEIERDKTVVYFSYCARTPEHRPLYDKGLSLNNGVFLRDCATSKHFKFVSADGISIYPEYTDFAHNRGGYDVLVYSVTFEALPLSTETIDIVEPCAEGFNFYGVDVRSPMTFRQVKKANPIPEN